MQGVSGDSGGCKGYGGGLNTKKKTGAVIKIQMDAG